MTAVHEPPTLQVSIDDIPAPAPIEAPAPPHGILPRGMEATTTPRSRAPLFWLLAAVALVVGLASAAGLAWTNDDAYISFRYADHLISGQGLVFNAGERVEGYSNFLWTLWCAFGMRLGVTAETWANVSGLVCFGATLLLLVAMAWTRRRDAAARVLLPVAALGLALHGDAQIFATGGLETSLFMLLATAGCAALTMGAPSRGRAFSAALWFGLAALSRPDGIVLAAFAGLWLVWDSRPRIGPPIAFACALAILLAPYLAWKLLYYGDLLPNTYYAKSANLAWWSQGLVYIRLFFGKYWVLGVGLALGLLALGADRVTRVRASAGAAGPATLDDGTVPVTRDASVRRRQLELALALSLGFTLYVTRVGGDFMFARFLIPVTPLMLVALEIGLERLVPPRAFYRALATLVVLAGIALALDPFADRKDIRGIVNEWNYYPPGERESNRNDGETLARFGEGLSLRIAFFGAQAAIARTSRVPVAIECATGLTDRFIARRPLARRGRIGHEKAAPWRYVLDERKAHLAIGTVRNDSLRSYVPLVHGRLGLMPVTVLRWEPAVIETLVRRGALIDDFPGRLDRFLALMPTMSDSLVAADYPRLKRFYFDVVADSARQAPLLARLDAMAPSRTSAAPALAAAP